MISTALQFSIRMTNRQKGVRLASVEDHEKVCNAIMAGDVAKAEVRMESLIQEALDLIRKAQSTGAIRG
jgi:DNA-binding FadR family transcriptional regulator